MFFIYILSGKIYFELFLMKTALQMTLNQNIDLFNQILSICSQGIPFNRQDEIMPPADCVSFLNIYT